MQLDKFQKNDVFLAITEAGLAPDRFELSFPTEVELGQKDGMPRDRTWATWPS